MPFERSERRQRLERAASRESNRDVTSRDQDDREFFARHDDDARYRRSGEPRHWRGHDYESDEELDRDRAYALHDRARHGPLRAEHRDRFLRRDEDKDLYRSGAATYDDWRGRTPREDDHWSGPYAGRGPKGYRRSDERIHEDVCERLTEHPSIDASDIDVAVSGGDVTLTGRIESRAIKHLTEVMVETVSGVKEVHNQLRVAPRADEDDWTSRRPEERRESRAQETIAAKTRRR